MSDRQDKKQRREFLKVTATGAVMAAGVGTAAAQQPRRATMPVNPQAKAVLPDATVVDRAEILRRLGLRPDVPPDAWLVIVNCGSNASALRPQQLREVVARGVVKREELDPESLKVLEAAEGQGPRPPRK